MSDKMRLIPFDRLIQWILEEKKNKGTTFGVHHTYKADPEKVLPIFGEKLETPYGPAAGPNTQLAQNIIAAYVAGSRFFELKTVQIMDGDELSACVPKPCINAEDECYNCEWSTELYVNQAFEEYVKAWIALKVISKEFGLGHPDGFVFNMSVGYDFAGITSPKIDGFIEGLKDAGETEVFKSCIAWLKAHVDLFEKVSLEDIDQIQSAVCTSITLSTLHGCPPAEIEKIASYLIEKKHLHTYIKCNPTLLGYEFARQRMDEMGYAYVQFGDFHFKDDLQYEDAVPMIGRLLDLAKAHDLSFGVKITNTFPVDVKRQELPSEEMYMSGRSLFPFSIAVAAKISESFGGKLRISYSGGADYYNIDELFKAGIWPITMATTVLKAGGYNRFAQIGKKLGKLPYQAFSGVDVAGVQTLSRDCVKDPHYVKPVKPLPSRKSKKKVPLIDCFTAPCKDSGCPIHQDIPAYIDLCGQDRYAEALMVILQKNPLPFITGAICAHPCMERCTRNFYEAPVDIRGEKLEAALAGFGMVYPLIKPIKAASGKKAAVIGGGPAGIAAATFLQKAGIQTTIYEKRKSLGGIVRYVIPEFRIPSVYVERDVSMMMALGVQVKTGVEIKDIGRLKAEGYDAIILATGAAKAGTLKLEKGFAYNALEVMEALKAKNQDAVRDAHQMDIVNEGLGKAVAVIGGGNSAMDAARAAKRAPGVEAVYLIYRRTKAYMPAQEEELKLAMADGVIFKELLAPVSHEDGKLICEKMRLGAPDASGRRQPEATGEFETIPADVVLAAVGEAVDRAYLEANDIALDARGRAILNDLTMASSVEDVYVIGDNAYGPSIVVQAIAQAQKAVTEIGKRLGIDMPGFDLEPQVKASDIYAKKGMLLSSEDAFCEAERCLSCANICENCVDVCPNRANVEIVLEGKKMPQILHIDMMCNECGNCKTFCPYDSAPYKDKFTLFACPEDFENSDNQGFCFVNKTPLTARVRLGAVVKDYEIYSKQCDLYEDIRALIAGVFKDYKYLFEI